MGRIIAIVVLMPLVYVLAILAASAGVIVWLALTVLVISRWLG